MRRVDGAPSVRSAIGGSAICIVSGVLGAYALTFATQGELGTFSLLVGFALGQGIPAAAIASTAR